VEAERRDGDREVVDEEMLTDGGIDSMLRPYVPHLLLGWPRDATHQTIDGTMVSADISGFTALSERLAAKGRQGVEELVTLISSCFDGMIEHCHALGGDILKFGGDALLVFFDGERHVERACTAAVAMRHTLRRPRHTSDGKRVPLKMSIGVHAGAHAFYVGRADFEDLWVTGPGATATVKAESAAGAGEILLSHPTASMLPASWLGERTPEGVLLRRVGRRPPPSWASPALPHRDPSEFVPPEQRPLIAAGALNEHRLVTIAFVAFADTDALAPEVLADRLQQLTLTIADACRRFGVFWTATDVHADGGKMILCAGAPMSRGRDEDRLLRAVRAVVDADPGLNLRAGINRGYVFAGDLGSPRRRTYTAMGDTTNLAARLLSRAAVDQIVVARTVVDWSGSEVEYTPLEPFMVKGKSRPIHAGRLGRVLGPRTDLDRVDTDLCGRDAELGRLLTLADEARRGRGSVTVITGEPGVGKSRLALEVIRRCPDLQVTFARCQPYDRLTPYALTESIMRGVLGIPANADSWHAGELLAGWLSVHAPELVPYAPLLAAALGGELPPTAESAGVAPEFRRMRTLQLLVDLSRRVVSRPTAILVDDVHHADDASREVLQALIESGTNLPLMVIATSAPGETLHPSPVALGPMGEAEVARLLDSLLGERSISADVVRDVITRSAGNPLFVGELVRALADDPHAAMPDSLEALVSSRIDALEPTDRQLLRQASVLGVDVDIELLGRAVGDERVGRPDRWDRLTDFVEAVAPGTVRFRFDTYWRVVYAGLSFTARRAMHRTVIDLIEHDLAVAGREPDGTTMTLLATHAGRTADLPRTWKYATAAAAWAAERSLFGTASQLFELALTARSCADRVELASVAERAASAFEHSANFAAADQALTLALSIRDAAPDRARLLRLRGEIAERRGDVVAAGRCYQRARAIWRTTELGVGIAEQAQLSAVEAGLAYRQARYATAWELATAAFAQAGLVDDAHVAARAGHQIHNLAFHMRLRGNHVNTPDVVALYRRAGDRVGEARHVNNLAVDLYFEGDWDRASELYREAAQLCVQTGDVVYEATALSNLAVILSDQGHLDEAEAMFRNASRTFRSVGFATGIAYVEMDLGRLATRMRQHELADERLHSAMERFQRLGAQGYLDECRLRLIENDLRAGRVIQPGDLEIMAAWLAASDQDANIVVYAGRLLAEATAAEGVEEATRAIDRSIEVARRADLLYELALSVRVRAALTHQYADESEASALLARLGVVDTDVLSANAPSG
jgi:class 3 adenylate cyclase/tetratricopeptide (TPR) repeat protein